jgi:hypothetical protein
MSDTKHLLQRLTEDVKTFKSRYDERHDALADRLDQIETSRDCIGPTGSNASERKQIDEFKAFIKSNGKASRHRRTGWPPVRSSSSARP